MRRPESLLAQLHELLSGRQPKAMSRPRLGGVSSMGPSSEMVHKMSYEDSRLGVHIKGLWL